MPDTSVIQVKEIVCQECEDAKYLQKEGRYVPCSCLQKEKLRKRLGSFAGLGMMPKTSMFQERLGKNLLIYGDLLKTRQHIARALVDDESRKCFAIPAQALLNFQFDNSDGGNQKLSKLREPQWVLILLGISDVPNCYLPELLVSLIADRKMLGKVTWVYSAKPGKVLYEQYRGSSGLNLRDWFAENLDEEVLV